MRFSPPVLAFMNKAAMNTLAYRRWYVLNVVSPNSYVET